MVILLARRPLEGSLADNWLKYGTGGLNIDACRVPAPGENLFTQAKDFTPAFTYDTGYRIVVPKHQKPGQ